MNLRNEVADFMVGYNWADDPQRDYYRVKRNEARKREQQDKENEKRKQEAIARERARRQQGAAIPQTTASTGMPGTNVPDPSTAPAPPPPDPVAAPQAFDPNATPLGMRRGGRVGRYKDGGSVLDPLDPMSNYRDPYRRWSGRDTNKDYGGEGGETAAGDQLDRALQTNTADQGAEMRKRAVSLRRRAAGKDRREVERTDSADDANIVANYGRVPTLADAAPHPDNSDYGGEGGETAAGERAQREVDDKNEADNLILEELFSGDEHMVGTYGRVPQISEKADGADTDDSMLSVGNAIDPPTSETAMDTGYAARPTLPQEGRARQIIAEQRIPRDEPPPLSEMELEAAARRTPLPPLKSPYRSWIEGEGGIDEDAANSRGKMEEWNQRMRERKQGRGAANAAVNAENNPFTPQTPQERLQSNERKLAAQAQANTMAPPAIVYPNRTDESGRMVGGDTGVATPPTIAPTTNLPYAPGVATAAQTALAQPVPPAPAPAPAPQGAVPGQSVVRATGTKRDQPLQAAPPAVAAAPPAVPPAAPSTQVTPANPSGAGPNPTGGQGAGTGAPQPPPPAAAAANTPSTAPKPAPAPQTAMQTNAPVPKGSLRDQTRTAAFDPVKDATDPGNMGFVDAQGRPVNVTQADMRSVVQGVQQIGQRYAQSGQIPLGDGAANRDSYRRVVQNYSNNGQLSEGEALLVGMTSMYKSLLSQGRVQEAATMAWGLIQAANLEAASLGMVAKDQMAQGNYGGALQTITKGVNLAPDGLKYVIGPNNTLIAVGTNGQPVGSARVDGKTMLAMALGLSDGTLMWEALNGAWQGMQKPDKDAEGRGLRNELTRRNILLAEKRLNAPVGGRGSTRGQISPEMEHIMRVNGTPVAYTPPPVMQGSSENPYAAVYDPPYPEN